MSSKNVMLFSSYVLSLLCFFALPAVGGEWVGRAVVSTRANIVLLHTSRPGAKVVGHILPGTILMVREKRGPCLRVAGGWIREGEIVDCEAARKTLGEVVGRSRYDSLSYAVRSRVSDYFGQFRDAEADAVRAIDLGGNSQLCYIARGTARQHLGQLDAALADFNRAVAAGPREAEAYFGRGSVLAEMGKYEEAMLDFTAALEREPCHHASYCARAFCRICRKQYDDAKSDLGHAIRLDPDDAISWTNRGSVLTMTGNFAAAVRDLDQAVLLDPLNAEAFNSRGVAKMFQREYGDARSDFDKAIRLSPRFWKAYYGRGWVNRKSEELDLAIRDFTRAIELAPGEAGLFRSRGGVYLSMREWGAAFRDYTVASQLVPEDPRSYSWMAWIMATCPSDEYRDGNSAIEVASKACELSDWQDAWDIMVLSFAYAECHNFETAIRWMEKAIKMEVEKDRVRFMKEVLRLFRSGMPFRDETNENLLLKLLGEYA